MTDSEVAFSNIKKDEPPYHQRLGITQWLTHRINGLPAFCRRVVQK